MSLANPPYLDEALAARPFQQSAASPPSPTPDPDLFTRPADQYQSQQLNVLKPI